MASGNNIEASGNNIENARETYAGFVSWFKWGAIVTFTIAAIVVLLIA